MAVTGRDLVERTDEPIRWNKLIAVLVWFIGVATTYVVMNDLGVAGVWGGAIALLLQLVLTRLESPVWRGDRSIVALAAVVLDTIINIGGAWSLVRGLHHTAPVQAINEMFGARAGPLNGVVAFVVCAALGVLLAVAPESIWND